MKKQLIFLFSLLLLISCNTEVKKKVEKKSNDTKQLSQKIPTYNYDGLKPLLHQKDAKTYVVNFWATWCKPCVKELPYFEKLHTTYKEKNVEVILVSLDFPNQVESRLLPFLEKKKLQSKVVLMVDPDQDTWIPKISEKWSGAIPATLIYNANNRAFFEKSFTYEELENELLKLLN